MQNMAFFSELVRIQASKDALATDLRRLIPCTMVKVTSFAIWSASDKASDPLTYQERYINAGRFGC
jgi:hypothetical protein